MNNTNNRQLGRLPSKHDPRTLRLATYRRGPLPPIPNECSWDKSVREWGVMGNDRYGNCVIVTAANALLAWGANELGQTDRLTDQEVIKLSREMGALDGYNILDRNKWWRSKGMWGNKSWAFALIDPASQPEIARTIYDFGTADIALNLPVAWQDAEVWDVGSGPRYRPGSWGGHSVPLVAYDAIGALCVTWGAIQPITWAAIAQYSDEAYAIIDPVWLAKEGQTPANLDLERLHADLHAITK